jgi:hypothetical protein
LRVTSRGLGDVYKRQLNNSISLTIFFFNLPLKKMAKLKMNQSSKTLSVGKVSNKENGEKIITHQSYYKQYFSHVMQLS